MNKIKQEAFESKMVNSRNAYVHKVASNSTNLFHKSLNLVAKKVTHKYKHETVININMKQ